MIKNIVKGFFSTPVGFLRELVGKRKVYLSEDKNIYKLGKQCIQCHKPMVHRDAISICQCYCFTHKDCLINQLNREAMSECTVIECDQCKQNIRTMTEFDYSFQPRVTLRDIITLSICIVICCLSMVYLVHAKNIENEQFAQNDLKNSNSNNNNIDSISIPQLLTLVIIFIFGMLFWITLMGMLFKRKTKVREIYPTNIEIKVSAFLEIQTKIRQESQHSIQIKKQSSDL